MSSTKYDAIILLGGAINADGSLPETTELRVQTAARLYKDGNAQVLIVCGSHGYKSIDKSALSEAQAFAKRLQDLGIPQDKIYLETESQETLGNILFAKMHILMHHNWKKLLVIPSINHSTERIRYLLQKILGNDYAWEILRAGENREAANLEREAKSLKLTSGINDQFEDGDHVAIYKGLLKTHPAYGGTKWTMEELRQKLSIQKPKLNS